LIALSVQSSWAGHCDGAVPAHPTENQPAEFVRSYRPFLKSPTRLAIDADDNLYIADPLNGRILARSPQGRIVLDWTHLNYPVSVAVPASGNLIVGDGHRGRVDIFDRSGQVVATLGRGDGEFLLPAFIATGQVAGAMRIYVVDSEAHSIKRYNGTTGAFELSFGGIGSADGQLKFPSGIALANGELLVVDRGNSRLQAFDEDGGFIRAIEPPADNCGFLCAFEGATRGRPHDTAVRVGEDGAIYVAETTKGRLLVLVEDGTGVATVGDFGSGPGELRVPMDLAVDSCGRLFVASAANSRIEVFGLPGYVDPEEYVPGKLTVPDQPVDPSSDIQLVAYLELPGYRPDEVGDILANGTIAPASTAVRDFNRDGDPDLELLFDDNLLSTLIGFPEANLTVTGSVAGLRFEESLRLQLVPGTRDADGDGVDDPLDACPGTAPGDLVGADGCSVSQRCPCAGPRDGLEWPNHGAYVTCVTRVRPEFVAAGILTRREAAAVVRRAARSQCGGPR
jgi:DNA-binding beta-propeller fold protein YncE